jgi:phosphoribosylpyrophosphate synthetase
VKSKSGDAADRLSGKWLQRVIVSDTVRVHTNTHLSVHTVSVVDLLSQAIQRLYRGESLSGLVTYE